MAKNEPSTVIEKHHHLSVTQAVQGRGHAAHDHQVQSPMDGVCTMFEAMRVFRATARHVDRYVEAELGHLRFNQWLALKVIIDGAARTSSELGARLEMTSGAVTRLVDSLEGHRLVARERDASDRRVVWLTVTHAGIMSFQEAALKLHAAWDNIFGPVDPEELDALVAFLAKLLQNAQNGSSASGREPSLSQ